MSINTNPDFIYWIPALGRPVLGDQKTIDTNDKRYRTCTKTMRVASAILLVMTGIPSVMHNYGGIVILNFTVLGFLKNNQTDETKRTLVFLNLFLLASTTILAREAFSSVKYSLKLFKNVQKLKDSFLQDKKDYRIILNLTNVIFSFLVLSMSVNPAFKPVSVIIIAFDQVISLSFNKNFKITLQEILKRERANLSEKEVAKDEEFAEWLTRKIELISKVAVAVLKTRKGYANIEAANCILGTVFKR